MLGDSDARTAYVIPATPAIAKRILGDEAERAMVFVDPDRALVSSLGLEHLPAFVHIRQDTSVGAVAEGWNPAQWQKVATRDRPGHGLVGARRRASGTRVPATTSGWVA